MAHWTLESILPTTKPYDTAELFGNHVTVNLKLKYTTSPLAQFKDPPILDWHEVIMMNEYHKKETWTFQANMYRHNPTSRTLLVWPRRYIAAYDHANGTAEATMRGSSRLTDKNGGAVGVDKLGGAGLHDNRAKADAVRNYLKKNGGILFIEIDDIPSINIPKDHTTSKERLVIFNCGLEDGGHGLRAMLTQHLIVDGSKPKNSWTRRVDLSHTQNSLNTAGLTKVPPPPEVSTPRQPVFAAGEYM